MNRHKTIKFFSHLGWFLLVLLGLHMMYIVFPGGGINGSVTGVQMEADYLFKGLVALFVFLCFLAFLILLPRKRSTLVKRFIPLKMR